MNELAGSPRVRDIRNLELTDADGHVCAFFRDVDEEYLVMLPFIKDGLDLGERACHMVETSRRQDHLIRMQAAGIDTVGAQASGQLVILDWSQTYLAGDGFEQNRIFAQLAASRAEGRDMGFRRTRYLAHMDWALVADAVDALAEYEATTNFYSLEGDVAICAYQSSRWPGHLLVNALRTHPLVILGGLLHENPFYQPPAEALCALKADRERACC